MLVIGSATCVVSHHKFEDLLRVNFCVSMIYVVLPSFLQLCLHPVFECHPAF